MVLDALVDAPEIVLDPVADALEHAQEDAEEDAEEDVHRAELDVVVVVDHHVHVAQGVPDVLVVDPDV